MQNDAPMHSAVEYEFINNNDDQGTPQLRVVFRDRQAAANAAACLTTHGHPFRLEVATLKNEWEFYADTAASHALNTNIQGT